MESTFDRQLNYLLWLVDQERSEEPFTAWFCIPAGLVMGKIVSEKKFSSLNEKPESPGDYANQLNLFQADLREAELNHESFGESRRIILQDARLEVGGRYIYMAPFAFVDPKEISAWGYGYALPNIVQTS